MILKTKKNTAPVAHLGSAIDNIVVTFKSTKSLPKVRTTKENSYFSITSFNISSNYWRIADALKKK